MKPEHLELGDQESFRANFDRRPFMVKHRLVGHPLFELSRLLELARTLPEHRVEYNAGDLAVSQDPNTTPRNGLSADETIRRIQDCKSWMALKNVELDPDYKSLLDECVDQVEPIVADLHSAMSRREAFIFLTSPGSITPYHMDPEHNFLLQVRGSKTVNVWNGEDRAVLSDLELERFHSGAARNLKYRDELDAKAMPFELKPGDGVHIPVTFPHWVKNGSEVSVSFSITFRSESSNRKEILYRINHRLRGYGLRPKPIGGSKFSDGLKFGAFDLARRASKMFRRTAPDAARTRMTNMTGMTRMSGDSNAENRERTGAM